MTCREFREELMEWARGSDAGPAVRSHVSMCEKCAEFLDRQRALTAALRGIAAEEIPPAPELPLGRRPRANVLAWPAAALLVAAASLMLFIAPTKPVTPQAAVQDPGQFLPIPYTVPLAPEERASVVQMDIPVTALLAAGFRMPAADPGAVARAEVIVSEDGRARAIRLISISNTD